MRIKQCFFRKEDPVDAKMISHKLMLRSGMVRQIACGIYSWLPVGVRIIKKIKKVICEELNKVGAIELEMPTLQPVELWEESGRYDDYGNEMLMIRDRHNRELVYGPTAEEVITDIARGHIKSYKQLPMTLYQIQTKFRDEIRPRFGVMRGREFCMNDAYSFCTTEESAKETYYDIYACYLEIFRRLGVIAIPVKAKTGPIGGDMSHEFQVLAQGGESKVYYDSKLGKLLATRPGKKDIEKILGLYAVSDDMRNLDMEKRVDIATSAAIEVGHIFNLGDKYSKAMNFTITDSTGHLKNPLMGCFGIGVSRLVAAIIEFNHDENGLLWPFNVSPFDVHIVNICPKDAELSKKINELYNKLIKQGVDVVIDDDDTSVGVKLTKADLLGVPLQIVASKQFKQDNSLELRSRRSKKKLFIKIDRLYNNFDAELLLEQVESSNV